MERQFRLGGILALALIALSVPSLMGQQIPKPPEPIKKFGNQPQQPQPQPVNPGTALRPTFSAQVSLPTNPDLERKLSAIPEYIAVKSWKEVTKALQEILDSPEDCFLPKENKGATQWVSVKAEANRLLGTLPAEGRMLYEVLSGGSAAALLQQAKDKSDLAKLADVALRYFHTKAGSEALDLLGTHNLDRGRFLMAAVCFDRLIQRPDADQLPAVSLFKATLALKRNGEDAKAEAAWKILTEKAKDGIALNLKKISLADLKKIIDQPVNGSGPLAAATFSMFRGDSARSGLAATKPLEFKDLKKAWNVLTVEEGGFGHSTLTNAVQQLVARSQPVVPGAVPIFARGKILFHTQNKGVYAADAVTGNMAWYSMGANIGLDNLPNGLQTHLTNWINQIYMQTSPNLLVENAAIGTLSTDGQRVFAVEDLIVPPYPNNIFNPNMGGAIAFRPMNAPNPTTNSDELAKVTVHNKLVALSLAKEGSMDWFVGGTGAKNPGPLDDAYFLGPPLPLGGKLYSLIEKDSELKLICLDPVKGQLQWTQQLINYKRTIQQDVGRRSWSAPMAYDQGILVCPSNSGAVVGVDLLTHSLVWAHAYLEAPKQPEVIMQPGIGKRPPIRRFNNPIPPKLAATWKSAGPIIADGKVIIAAPDSAHIECLNLRDGGLIWKKDRATTDNFVGHIVGGIYKENVVVVGDKQVRALGLKDGATRWQVTSGMPSGQGVSAGNIYYLPVRSMEGAAPGILAIDMDKGSVVSRISTPGNEVPGNLVIVDGQLLSQTPTAVTAYSLAK